MGRYIHVAELTGGLVSLNTSTTAIGTRDVHGVGFGGILGVPSIEPLLGGGESGRRALSTPPPPKRKPGSPSVVRISGRQRRRAAEARDHGPSGAI